MAKIEQRFKEIAYKPKNLKQDDDKPKNPDVLFFICEELSEGDFKEPFFNFSQIINLHNGFKFLSYCGKNQNKNINKNALVIMKKLSKDNKIIYRAYLMDKEGFNIRELFLKHAKPNFIGEHNGYNLSPSHYIDRIKEHYNKEEIVYIINKILNDLTEWSLKQ